MFIRKRLLVLVVIAVLGVAGIHRAILVYEARHDSQPVHSQPVIQNPVARGTDLPVFYVETSEMKMALTFDISWGEKTPDLILPILKEKEQKATFFLSGPWSEDHVEIVRQIVEDGHEIASHGHKHDNFSQLSREDISDNISRAHEILKRVAGTEPRFLRPPNGDYDDLSVATARDLGYETVIWSVDSLDWKNPGVDFMVDRVQKMAFPGAILLFHASDSSQQTHLALPTIIDNLRAEGYTLVTLGDLMDSGSPSREDPRGRPKPSHPS